MKFTESQKQIEDLPLCLSLSLTQVLMPGTQASVEVDEVDDLSQLE